MTHQTKLLALADEMAKTCGRLGNPKHQLGEKDQGTLRSFARQWRQLREGGAA